MVVSRIVWIRVPCCGSPCALVRKPQNSGNRAYAPGTDQTGDCVCVHLRNDFESGEGMHDVCRLPEIYEKKCISAFLGVYNYHERRRKGMKARKAAAVGMAAVSAAFCLLRQPERNALATETEPSAN